MEGPEAAPGIGGTKQGHGLAAPALSDLEAGGKALTLKVARGHVAVLLGEPLNP